MSPKVGVLPSGGVARRSLGVLLWARGVFVALPGARGLGAEFWLYLGAYVVFMVAWPLAQLAPLFPSDQQEA